MNSKFLVEIDLEVIACKTECFPLELSITSDINVPESNE